jgi:PPK2 family polyphosphate:nucleotide phosphotransferase
MTYARSVSPGDRVDLRRYDTKQDGGLNRKEAEAKTGEFGEEMQGLLDMLFYAGQHALLIVLQGRDTSGKDGTIRCILKYSNAQSCRVVPFKVPTEEEMAHDFLWRVHKQTPHRGAITIFNRSHYEDVLVVRVHDLVPKQVWQSRYAHINHFERLLTDSSTIILKFFLHISKDEQEERLLEREQEPEKAWKLSMNDWKEREYWDDYTAAYEDALTKCSTEEAPWHIISADHKWFRNLAITEQIVKTLRPYRKPWLEHLEATGKKAKAELLEYRQNRRGE